MLQDLELGIKSEIEYINGILSKTGRKFGITTPVNDRVVEIVKGIEKGLLTPCIENLNMFTEIYLS